MKKNENNNKSNGKNGYDIILETYNSKLYPVIENQMNATVFPWSMQRDVDAIDTLRFSQEVTAWSEQLGVDHIPASPTNVKANEAPNNLK